MYSHSDSVLHEGLSAFKGGIPVCDINGKSLAFFKNSTIVSSMKLYLKHEYGPMFEQGTVLLVIGGKLMDDERCIEDYISEGSSIFAVCIPHPRGGAGDRGGEGVCLLCLMKRLDLYYHIPNICLLLSS